VDAHHSKPGSSLERGHISMSASLTAQQKDTHQLCNCDATPMCANRRQISEQQQACMVMMKILGVALGAYTDIISHTPRVTRLTDSESKNQCGFQY
jgi:hypothetical protein